MRTVNMIDNPKRAYVPIPESYFDMSEPSRERPA